MSAFVLLFVIAVESESRVARTCCVGQYLELSWCRQKSHDSDTEFPNGTVQAQTQSCSISFFIPTYVLKKKKKVIYEKISRHKTARVIYECSPYSATGVTISIFILWTVNLSFLQYQTTTLQQNLFLFWGVKRIRKSFNRPGKAG